MRAIARRLNRSLYNIDEAYFLSFNKKRVSRAELCVMYALDDGQLHSQKEISEEWLVPKTSVNTIVKRWEKEGFLTMVAIPGKRREMQIMLTDKGREYAKGFLAFVYEAEEKALKQTIAKYSEEFVEAIEYFGHSIKCAFEEEYKKQQ